MRTSSALGIGGAAIFCSFNPALRTALIRVHSGQESRTAADSELDEEVYSYVPGEPRFDISLRGLHKIIAPEPGFVAPSRLRAPSTPAFFAIALSLRRKCPSGLPSPLGNTRYVGRNHVPRTGRQLLRQTQPPANYQTTGKASGGSRPQSDSGANAVSIPVERLTAGIFKGGHNRITDKHLYSIVRTLGFMLHLAAGCSCALKVVSSMGESRRLSHRNPWIR